MVYMLTEAERSRRARTRLKVEPTPRLQVQNASKFLLHLMAILCLHHRASSVRNAWHVLLHSQGQFATTN